MVLAWFVQRAHAFIIIPPPRRAGPPWKGLGVRSRPRACPNALPRTHGPETGRTARNGAEMHGSGRGENFFAVVRFCVCKAPYARV